MISDEMVEKALSGVESHLVGMMVGGCTCDTKSPTLDFHDLRCKYRQASEAMGAVENLRDTLEALSAPESGAEAAGDREVLLFTSYCGGDNPDCSPSRPCPVCLGMSNVFRVKGGSMTFARELAPSWNGIDALSHPESLRSPAEATRPAEAEPVVKALEWRKSEICRYGAALRGWLDSLKGAGTWDTKTLERVDTCIGPILAEMMGALAPATAKGVSMTPVTDKAELALLPCPFCGGEISLQPSHNAPEALWVFACPEDSPCRKSGLGQYALTSDLPQAIATWNRRATPAVDKLVEALQPFADILKGNYSHQADAMPIVAGFNEHDLRWQFSLGDSRRAREALEARHR